MNPKIILALDGMDGLTADKTTRLLWDYVDGFKINHTLYGLADYINVKDPDKELFVDFKLWDTSNTVRNVIKDVISHGATMTTVSTYNNPEVFKIISEYGRNDIKLFGVSSLTSWTTEEASIINGTWLPPHQMTGQEIISDLWKNHLKRISDCNFTGVICPVEEIEYIDQIDDKLLKVCPGISPNKWLSNYTGQVKVSSMDNARKKGADYVVVGRSIINAEDPLKAIKVLSKGGK